MNILVCVKRVPATAGKVTGCRCAGARPLPRYHAASPATATIASAPNRLTAICIAAPSWASRPSRAKKPKKMPEQNTGNEFCPSSTSGPAMRGKVPNARGCGFDPGRGSPSEPAM